MSFLYALRHPGGFYPPGSTRVHYSDRHPVAVCLPWNGFCSMGPPGATRVHLASESGGNRLRTDRLGLPEGDTRKKHFERLKNILLENHIIFKNIS